MCLVLTCEKMFHAEVAEVSLLGTRRISLNFKTTLLAPLRVLCVLCEKMFHAEVAEVSQSSRRICWPSKTVLLAPLRMLCVLCEKMFHAKHTEVKQIAILRYTKKFVELKNHSLSAFAHALCTL